MGFIVVVNVVVVGGCVIGVVVVTMGIALCHAAC